MEGELLTGYISFVYFTRIPVNIFFGGVEPTPRKI